MKPQRETLGILQRIYILPLAGLFFFNPKKQTSRLWQGGKENRCSWHALELYVSKLTAKIHLPVVCFPAKPCSAAWVTTHWPSAHTGTPGIWSSSCYLCLLNTNLHMFSPHWVYIKLQILFFPQCWSFLDMPDTVPGAPCSNRGEMLMSLWKLHFQMVQMKMLLKLEEHCVMWWKIN